MSNFCPTCGDDLEGHLGELLVGPNNEKCCDLCYNDLLNEWKKENGQFGLGREDSWEKD